MFAGAYSAVEPIGRFQMLLLAKGHVRASRAAVLGDGDVDREPTAAAELPRGRPAITRGSDARTRPAGALGRVSKRRCPMGVCGGLCGRECPTTCGDDAVTQR